MIDANSDGQALINSTRILYSDFCFHHVDASARAARLLVAIGVVACTHLVVPQFVRILRCSYNSKVVLQLLLFQVTLREIFQLALAEAKFGRAGNCHLCPVPRNRDIVVSKLACLPTDFDSILKILLELSNIKNLIVDRLCAVDGEFHHTFLALYLERENVTVRGIAVDKLAPVPSCSKEQEAG